MSSLSGLTVMKVNQQGFTSPYAVQFADNERDAVLLEAFTYTDSLGIAHTAPEGFTFDGGSIPRAFWTLIGSPYTGKARRAYPIHDWDCAQARLLTGRMRWLARAAADLCLLEMCQHLGVSRWRRVAVYAGVRVFAVAGWRRS